jgi:hypothetical protein
VTLFEWSVKGARQVSNNDILYTVLGASDLVGTQYVNFLQLPNGDIFVLDYVDNSSSLLAQNEIEILEPGTDSITNVTSAAISGVLSQGSGGTPPIAELYVGDSSLPDIILAYAGLDQPPWSGGQLSVLAPTGNGQYEDVTSRLPQQLAYNGWVSTGEINGQAAIAVDMDTNETGLPIGVELLIANTDGTFTNISSHLPTFYSSTPFDANTAYTTSVIADFTGNGGDIFLGAEYQTPSILLVNNGAGYFSAETLNIAKPTFADGGFATVESALATKFAGDSSEDLIIDYVDQTYNTSGSPNPTGNAYYIQFLKGDGHGGFTDVTSQYFPDQPQLTNGFGGNGYVSSMQFVNINGENDLILYIGTGAPEILIENDSGAYSLSPVQVFNVAGTGFGSDPPLDIVHSTWGSDNGVGGFYGLTNGSQWVFVPITSAYLNPTTGTLNDPLASKLYLYGNGSAAAGATRLAQSYDTAISVTFQEYYLPGATHTVDVIVNGVDLGAQDVQETPSFLHNGQEYTNETLTFSMSGLASINSLEIVQDAAAPYFYPYDVDINGVDLGGQPVPVSSTAHTIDASAWNSTLNTSIGTAADPIQVSGTGTSVTAYVLGSSAEYKVGGIGTSTVTLAESSGLDQNAVLTDVAFVDFQDGSSLNTQTGAWSATIVASAANNEPSYIGTVYVVDAAADVSANIDALQALAATGRLALITLTDTSTPTVAVADSQYIHDSAAINDIGGAFNVSIAVSGDNETLAGLAGHPTTAVFAGDVGQFSLTLDPSGAATVSGLGQTIQLAGVQVAQFNDGSWIFPTSASQAIHGGGGDNTVVYSSPSSNYSVTVNADGSLLVTSSVTAEGPDTLTNIQQIQFADTTVTVPTINTAALPTYDLSAPTAAATEGSTVDFALEATNVAAGTVLSYSLTGVTAAEVVGGSLTGTVTVGAGGTATIPVTLTNTPGQDLSGDLAATIALPFFSATASVTSAEVPLTETATPAVLDIAEAPSSAHVAAGTVVSFALDLNQAMTVTGDPTLTLSNGGAANYASGSGGHVLVFDYTVGATGVDAATLTATAINLSGGAIQTVGGFDAQLSLSGVAASQYDAIITSPGAGAVLTGGTGNDLFYLTGANDTVHGGSGLNTVVFTGSVEQYTVGQSGSAITVTDSVTGRDGTVTLNGVQQAEFSDITLVFDLHSAEDLLVYELYQAAYDRVPDNAGYRFWAGQGDANHLSALQLADAFLAAPEFTQKYGANPTNTQYVTELYTNVLGRAPDPAGLAFWIGQANAGDPRDSLMVAFATSPENVQLIGSHIADGYWTTH